MKFKPLLIALMKYSLIVFILTLSLSVLTAGDLDAQKSKSIREVNIDLNIQDASVKEALAYIESKTDFVFNYDQRTLKKLRQKINISRSSGTVEDALVVISNEAKLNFRQINKNINVINSPDEDESPSVIVAVEDIDISGKVTSADDGSGIPGVNVVIKGAAKGTVTDMDGRYSLSVPSEETVLIFSSVGLVTQEVAVGSDGVINIQMSSDITALDELVVVGYGTQEKVNLTGAVDVITNKALKNRSNSNVSMLLEGSAVGINFDLDRNGYQPGAEGDITLRGIGSLNGGTPFVVIDGFAGDMNRLNPQDIESITILKDAAASAIYGARAPYGVILITTKSGGKNKKLSVSYNGSMSLVTPAKLPNSLDSYTFARVINEAASNRGSSHPYTDEHIDRIIAYQEGDYDYLASQFPANFPMDKVVNWDNLPGENGSWYGGGHANNDLWDIYTGPNVGHLQNFSIQGGGEKTSYYFSFGYLDQASSLELGDDSFKRYNVMAKVNTELTDWWDFRYETRFMKSNRHFPNGSRPETQDTYNALFHIIYNTPPNSAVFTNFGDDFQGYNQFFKAGFNDDERTENWQIFATELRPAKGWKVNANFAYQSIDKYDLHDGQEFNMNNWLTGEPTSSWYPSQVYEYQNSDFYWTSNMYTSYELSLNDAHNFLVMGGTQLETGTYRALYANARGLIVPEVISLSTATGTPEVRESLSHWATQGYYGRFTYNYKQKYLFESNVRYDGTSRFQEGKRWGFFPSFSAGWNVSYEDFWEPIAPIVNDLKIRASWGELGNQNVSSYQDLALIGFSKQNLSWLPGNAQVGQVGYTLTPGLVSPVLTWETAATTNIGVNMAFLENKLQLDFDWFERNTTNMIGPAEAYPGVLGASAPRSNNASLQTRGFELALRWQQELANGLGYYANLNLYDATAVVTKYHNPTGYLGSWREGQEVGEIWGWSSGGMFKTQEEIDNHADQSYIYNVWNTGDLKYDDINGDGVIDKGENTIDDHGDLVLLGNSSPHYQFGISAGVDFKGFDFSMIWKGIAKRDLGLDGFSANAYYGFFRTNWSQPKEEHLDYYRDQPGTEYSGLNIGEANINTDAYYTRPYLDWNSSMKNYNANSWFLANYAYLRLQNVQLGYSLPDQLISRIGLQQFRIYFSGDNLLTLHHLPDGMDPTTPGGGYRDNTGKEYRADRIYSLGINITY